MSDDLVKRLQSLHKQATVDRSHFYVGSCAEDAMHRIEELELAVRYEADLAQMALDARKELEAKLAKAVTELKMFTDVSKLMQSATSHNKHRHNTVITDTMWAQWSKQLRFALTALAALNGVKDYE